MLILTGMNFENKATLYEEANKSLKNFMGDGGHTECSSKSINLESAFLAENKEALFAVGYVKRGDSYRKQRNGRSNYGGG
jgi:hypothetical protein